MLVIVYVIRSSPVVASHNVLGRVACLGSIISGFTGNTYSDMERSHCLVVFLVTLNAPYRLPGFAEGCGRGDV